MSTIIKESSWDSDRNGKKWEDYDTIECLDGEIIDMQKLLDEQQRAKAALVHLLPAFGDFVNRFRYIYTFRVSTQATDGKHIFVNPQFTSHLDLTEKTFVLAHEIMHNLLNHLRREKSGNYDHERANEAQDYEINITLSDIELFKFETMKRIGALIDKKYSGWGWEKIYDDKSMPRIGNQSGSMCNNDDAKKQGNNKSGQSGQQKKYSEDYKKGWEQAIEDIRSGKIKI